MEELITLFSLDNVGKSASVFNPDKLSWLNSHYIKTGDRVRLAQLLSWHLKNEGIDASSGSELEAIVVALQDRCKTLVEMAQQAMCFFGDEVQFDEIAVAKFIVRDNREIFETLLLALDSCHDWREEVLDEVFKGVLHATGLKFGKLAQPARVALTGSTNGPSICVIMEILGRAKTLARLQDAIARTSN